MNETRILDLIETLNTRVGELAGRVAALELAVAKPPVEAAYTSPESWEAKQRAVEARCGHDPQTVEDAKIGKAWREDSSLEKWFPFIAEELKKLQQPKWRDAKSDPPDRDGVFLAYLTGRPPSSRYMIGSFDRLTGAWDTEDGALVTSYVTHWQELPPPPDPLEPYRRGIQAGIKRDQQADAQQRMNET